MNGYEFFASLTSSVLSWPVAVFAIALMLRKQIRGLLMRLKKTTLMGQDFSFGEGIERAEHSTAEVLGDAGSPVVRDSESNHAADKAQESPSLLIIDSWTKLEEQVEKLYASLGLKKKSRYQSPSEMARELLAADVVNESYLASIQELGQLRNLVAHGKHVPLPGEAATYAKTAQDLIRATEVLGRHLLHPRD